MSTNSFRLGVDPMPDWFMDLVTLNKVILHGKPEEQYRKDKMDACAIVGRINPRITCLKHGEMIYEKMLN